MDVIEWVRVTRIGDAWLKECSPLRAETLPARYDEWTHREPRLRPFAPCFSELCASLTRRPTVQHDDVHEANVFARQAFVGT
jgi:hypothetical protein